MLSSNATNPKDIYQLKITLRGIRPPIWRRVQVDPDISLGELHRIIQIVMGWSDYHLHQFTAKGVWYGPPDPDLETVNERLTKLSQIAPDVKAKFRYEYDFGDRWEHDIVVEKILPAEPGVVYPVCIAGKRACPPEDSGGIWGYADLLETLADPNSEEYEHILEWIGGEFDPEAFDLDAINRRLHGSHRGRKAA